MSQAFIIIYHQIQFSEDWILLLVSSTWAFFSTCFFAVYKAQVLWGGADKTLIPRLTPGTLGPWDLGISTAEASLSRPAEVALGNVKKEVLQVQRWPNDWTWHGPLAHLSDLVWWFAMIYRDLPWFKLWKMEIFNSKLCRNYQTLISICALGGDGGPGESCESWEFWPGGHWR